ncbi:neuronal growth regulator 1-like, partial [Saccoglossus kowalevskii]
MIVHITLAVFAALWSKVNGFTWKDIPDQEVYIQLDSSVTLKCAFQDGTPAASTEWTQESPTFRLVSSNSAIFPGSCDECSITGDSSNAEFYLTIDPIKADHIGTWRCTNIHLSPQYYETHIIIREPATIITPPSDQTVNEGGSVTFECTSTGVPDVTYTWQKDSTDIDIDGRYAVTVGSLTIYNIEKSDYGTYTCIADNGVGSGDSKSAVLTVNFKPDSATLSGYTGAVTSGSNIVLTCTTTTSNPSATILWYRNNIRIYDNDDNINIGILIETNGDYNGKISEQQITITTRAEDNQAEYKCKAKNSRITGDVNSNSVLITVYFKPDSAGLSGYTSAVNSGSDILLTCTTTTSNPSATILWYRNNNKIDDNDDNINIGTLTETNGDYNGKISEQQITITTRAEDNQAEYKCKARNSQVTGDVNSDSVPITVYYTPFPVNETQNEQSRANDGKTGKLRCQFNSNPTSTLQWFGPNGNVLTSNDRITISNSTQGTLHESIITITKTESDDYGNYTCFAESDFANATFIVMFDGKSRPYPVSDIELSSSHNTINLTWFPGFNGGESQSFYIEYW